MSVDLLRMYLVGTSSTREKINLRQFGESHLKKTGKQPELLCDFFPVLKWLCSALDYHNIDKGTLSPYSLLYGNCSKSYEERMVRFVTVIRSLGVEPVFFVECCPFTNLESTPEAELYHINWCKDLDNCSNILQVCAGHCELSKVCWNVKEGVVFDVLAKLVSECNANIVYCGGKVPADTIPYMRANKNVCGILTWDTCYALVPHCGLFLLDLFPADICSPGLEPFKPEEGLNCEVIWSSWLAGSLELEEDQLADLGILCGNVFTSVLNVQLHAWDVLGIVKPDVNLIAKWISRQSTALIANPVWTEFLAQNANYELAVRLSYKFLTEEKSPPDVNPEFAGFMERVCGKGSLVPMQSVLSCKTFARPVLLEPDTLKQPCFCNATAKIRSLIYLLCGLPKVIEVGSTQWSSSVVSERKPDKTVVEIPWWEEGEVSFTTQLNLFSEHIRLAILYNGVSFPPDVSERNNYEDFLQWCIREAQEAKDLRVSCTAVLFLSTLAFVKSCNQLVPSPDLYVCELEALLVTCLFLMAGIPPLDFPNLPNPKSVTIGSRFAHVLDQAFWLASCLGLSHGLPMQGEVFSPFAYIPIYHICFLYERYQDLPQEWKDRTSLSHLMDAYREVWELDAVLHLRAEFLMKSSYPSFAEAIKLFDAALKAVVESSVLVEIKNQMVQEQANRKTKVGSSCPGSKSCQNSFVESLLETNGDAVLSLSDSMSSLERSELSYTLECHALEEDHYYSNEPLLTGGVDGEEFELCQHQAEKREAKDGKGKALGMENGSEEEEDILLKVTVESILSESKVDDPPVLMDSDGRKIVPVDSVLVSTSNSSKLAKNVKYPSKKQKHKKCFTEPASKLPIMEHQEKILELIRNHSVVCIEGETGCGKSTMVPQFILDETSEKSSSQSCNIIVTQPRRVAAVKLAERVAAERREKVGKTVGYCVSGSYHRAPETKLTYCTVGYFLQVLIHNPSAIEWYSHIILDEVHERSMDTDFVMLVIRRLVSSGQKAKLILMSATMQGEMLTKYFAETFHFSLVSTPYFVGAKRYPVKQYFHDDLGELADGCTATDSPEQKSCNFLRNLSKVLSCLSIQQSMVRYPSVTDLNMDICTHLIISQARLGESILVFLPGIASISLYYERLTNYIAEAGLVHRFKLFILHSQVSFEDQKDAFEDPFADVVHIILATNIAESSITLPKLRMVVNFGIYHHLNYDPKRRTSCLKRRWCSRASCAQRAGRAGRVFDGIVVHLFTKRFHDTVLSSFDPPEILTAPLAKLILQVKMICKQLGESSPSEFLSGAIEYPPMEQMQVALKDLSELGAIAARCTGKDNNTIDEEADITFLGYFCLALPIELSLCRLVLYSVLLGIPFEGVVVAGSLSLYQNVFTMPSKDILSPELFIQRLKSSTTSRVTFDGGHYSHAVQICALFKKWIEFRNANLCALTAHSKFSMIHSFCLNVGVRWERLFQLESAVADIAAKVMAFVPEGHSVYTELLNLTKLTDHRKDLMAVAGRKRKIAQYSEINVHYCEDPLLIKALMVAAFSNQLLIGKRAVDWSNTKHGRQASSAMKIISGSGMDPSQTLVMHNLQAPSLPALQFLALSVLPNRQCNVMIQSDMGFISLVPKFGSNPKTVLMVQQAAMRGERIIDPDTQNSPWNPFMMEESVVQRKLAPDLVYLWQYGENKPIWNVPGLQESFTRASHPYLVRWERLMGNGERAYNKNWRQPIQTLVDINHNDNEVQFFAVAGTMQGTSHDKVVSVSDISVLPNRGTDACSSLIITLAFLPASTSLKFLFSKDHRIIGMKIEKHHIFFHSSQFLSLEDVVRINALRKALSGILASSNEEDLVLEMGKVGRVHSLLDCVLRRAPANLVSNLPSPSAHVLWEVVDFGIDKMEEYDEESSPDSDGDSSTGFPATEGKVQEQTVHFYPPMNLAILSKVKVKEIDTQHLRSNYLFLSSPRHSRVQDLSISESKSNFQLSPLAKSFVPQCCTKRKRNPPELQSKKTPVITEVASPADMQLKLFQPQPTTVSGILTSSSSPVIYENSYDVSHLDSFFPVGFPGFGTFHAPNISHFNPSVVLQASPGRAVAQVSSDVLEFEVPRLSSWSCIEAIAQINQKNFAQCCLTIFGQMLMSKLRLRPLGGGRFPERIAGNSSGFSELSAEADSVEPQETPVKFMPCTDVDVAQVSDEDTTLHSPTEQFLSVVAPSQQASLRALRGMKSITPGNCANVSKFHQQETNLLISSNPGSNKTYQVRPQPCMRYNPPVYIPPPAFSVIQSLAHRRIPPVVREHGRGNQKLRVPPPPFMSTGYTSRYEPPVWLSNMLCAPPKVHPCDIYKVQVAQPEVKDQTERKNNTIFTMERKFPGADYIPPAGSILNTACGNSFVFHKTRSKKEMQMPPHQVYGITDDIVAHFYCDYLYVVGKCSIAVLCGPVYKSWLLNVCSVSLGVQHHLPLIFFGKFPDKFCIATEKSEKLVSLVGGRKAFQQNDVLKAPSEDDSKPNDVLNNPEMSATMQSETGSGSAMPKSAPIGLLEVSQLSVKSELTQLEPSGVIEEQVAVEANSVSVTSVSNSESNHSNSSGSKMELLPPPGFGPLSSSTSTKSQDSMSGLEIPSLAVSMQVKSGSIASDVEGSSTPMFTTVLEPEKVLDSCRNKLFTQSVSAHTLHPPLDLNVQKNASECVLSNLHKALIDYGIDDFNKLVTVMKTVEEQKKKISPSPSENKPAEVPTHSMQSLTSCASEVMQEEEDNSSHFSSALLSGSTNKPVTDENSVAQQSSSAELMKDDSCVLDMESLSSQSTCALPVATDLVVSSPQAVQTLPHLYQDRKTEVADRTSSYLLSIIHSKSEVTPELPTDSIKCGAIYCSNLESLAVDQEDNTDLHSHEDAETNVQTLYSQGDSKGNCSDTGDEHINTLQGKENNWCDGQSTEKLQFENVNLHSVEKQDRNLSCSFLSESLESVVPGVLTCPEDLESDQDAWTRLSEGLDNWCVGDEDDPNNKSIGYPNTESHSWPDLSKGDSKNEPQLEFASAEKSSNQDVDKANVPLYSVPVPIQSDRNEEGPTDFSGTSAGCHSAGSVGSWEPKNNTKFSDGILPSVHTVNLCKVDDIGNSAAANLSLEEGWSAINSSDEDRNNATEQQQHEESPSVNLSLADSTDWVETPRDFSEQNESPVCGKSSKSRGKPRSPDQEWYVTPPRKVSDNPEQNSKLVVECMHKILKDGPATFYTIVSCYRKRYPGYPFLTKDHFFSNPDRYTCTMGKNNALLISLNHPPKTSSSGRLAKKTSSADWQPRQGSSEGKSSSHHSSPSSLHSTDNLSTPSSDDRPAVKVLSSFDQDQEVVVKEVVKVLKMTKSYSIRCSQIRSRLSVGFRPRLDRQFFLRHCSWFEIEEIRHKREGDENDFFVRLIVQKIRNAGKGQQKGGGAVDDEEAPVSRSRAEGGGRSRKGMGNSPPYSGEEKKKKKKRKPKADRLPCRSERKNSHHRLANKGRGTQPLYVYGSGLPFYCTKAESENEQDNN